MPQQCSTINKNLTRFLQCPMQGATGIASYLNKLSLQAIPSFMYIAL